MLQVKVQSCKIYDMLKDICFQCKRALGVAAARQIFVELC